MILLLCGIIYLTSLGACIVLNRFLDNPDKIPALWCLIPLLNTLGFIGAAFASLLATIFDFIHDHELPKPLKDFIENNK